MDLGRLGRGEQIAGLAGLSLFVIMFLDWFGVKDIPGGADAWESFSLIDIVIFLAAVSGVALALVAASASDPGLPVSLSAVVTGLAAFATLLILFRIISPVDFTASTPLGDASVDGTRKIGLFLGLIAAGILTYGGWLAMQEEDADFGDLDPR
jgi:hypothetical protein